MDFIDELKQFSVRVQQIKDTITTEEATKMSIIVPFFQMLGYDVFNPNEFTPEYTADVGIKKGEKVDYAIMKDGKPQILIECKCVNDNLDKHASQLFRYFGTSDAKFGILTNGIIYKFYTDLDEANKMDLVPFLEFDILNIKNNTVKELKKFKKEVFDADAVFSTASKLKYSNAIKENFKANLENPDDDFIRFFLGNVYNGVKTQTVIDNYRDVVKNALNEFITESMSDKITAVLNQGDEEKETKPAEIVTEEQVEEEPVSKIVTTEEELQAFYIIKGFFAGICKLDDITYKDTESYFGILYQGNIRKTLCRIYLGTKTKQILLPNKDKTYSRYYIDAIDDIYKYKDLIIKSLQLYI